MVAAERGVWTAAELGRLMESKGGKGLSPASMSVLMTKQPKEVKLDTLAALCAALDCTPNDLIVLTPDEERQGSEADAAIGHPAN
jgi:DNA-binding Xre family transcriptional regulator